MKLARCALTALTEITMKDLLNELNITLSSTYLNCPVYNIDLKT